MSERTVRQVDAQEKMARVAPHMTVAEAATVMAGLKASGTLVMEHDRLVRHGMLRRTKCQLDRVESARCIDFPYSSVLTLEYRFSLSEAKPCPSSPGQKVVATVLLHATQCYCAVGTSRSRIDTTRSEYTVQPSSTASTAQVGILTTRDILFRVIAVGYPPHTTLVSQVSPSRPLAT